ncbi:MAG: SH3 domain-containing protein [Candidatus Omnitrophica bacterium]|nr:SH3 domain-containing protein [Candidatus Omnitrophota bacterium]
MLVSDNRIKQSQQVFIFLIAGLILITANGCASHTPSFNYSPPSILPATTADMKTAGYWIGRHPTPDQTILTVDQIKLLNESIINPLELNQDLNGWPIEYSGPQIRKDLMSQWKNLRKANLMQLDGTSIPNSYWPTVLDNMNLRSIPEKVTRQYGLVVHYAAQRVLPTEDGLFSKANDIDFDELQNSALDIGTPVVVLATSLDGEWVYAQSVSSGGWIKTQNIGLVDREDFVRMTSDPFVVMIDSKVDVFKDPALTQHKGYLQMGAHLPFVSEDKGKTVVLIPEKNVDGRTVLVPGFIITSQVNKGYLAYTPRTMLIQAFKMLNEPYGWGGMYGEQDCSRFLQQIFSTVGIQLPRNSSAQIQVGARLDQWSDAVNDEEKLSLLKNLGIGGVTVLGMKGHILLYLGSVDSHAYAIHAVWAYRQPGQSEDDVFVLNKVTVSSLTLGEGSKKGSLLKRLNAVRLIGEKQ